MCSSAQFYICFTNINQKILRHWKKELVYIFKWCVFFNPPNFPFSNSCRFWRPFLRLRMASLRRSPGTVKSASSSNAHCRLSRDELPSSVRSTWASYWSIAEISLFVLKIFTSRSPLCLCFLDVNDCCSLKFTSYSMRLQSRKL